MNFFVNKKILLVFAHPDDEVLGCGGLIHRFSQHAKITPAWTAWIPDMVLESSDALYVLGLTGSEGYRRDLAPDNEMDDVTQLQVNKLVELFVQAVGPDIIITHHVDDLNIDHRMTAEAVITAARPFGSQISILMSEVLSASGVKKPWNFDPNLYVHLDEQNLEAKVQAMSKYESQCREFPHPRSLPIIQARARYHGAMSGSAAAEAFQIYRMHA